MFASGSSSFGRPKLSATTLPSYSDAIHEKHRLTGPNNGLRGWLAPVDITIPPLPVVGRRRVRLCLPTPLLHQLRRRPLRRRGVASMIAGILIILWTIFALHKRFATRSKSWPGPFAGDPPTLIYDRADLRRIWLWEIASGHYPSSKPLPAALQFPSLPLNPGTSRPQEKRLAVPQGATIGTGVSRTYFHINVTNPPYPPRPIPGSIIDLDVVQQYCHFSTKQYVRDCLEILRLGAGLNYGNSLRRQNTDHWMHIYTEGTDVGNVPASTPIDDPTQIPHSSEIGVDPNAGLEFSRKSPKEPQFTFKLPLSVIPFPLLKGGPCDPNHPRLYHIFWAGPFTDKPYIAILSFLFTQNVGLHRSPGTPAPQDVCQPQLWLWINPGPAASVANPRAVRDMYNSLAANPWSAPFLHPRFQDVVKFKLWNTTEQLDGIPEIKDEWRKLGSLFNAGGNVYKAPGMEKPLVVPSTLVSASNSAAETSANETMSGIPDEPPKKGKGGLYDRLGSNSESEYDRMSVILSDMARFVLCHRFGGTYLDADTILLRDWEELWGWKGAFAYRWSRLEKYNTAVLRLHKNSALGSWLFRTALKNDFDFHPMTVSNYAKEAHMDSLLQRLPDALFDPAWLNVEDYQSERPAFPYFTEFKNLFQLPRETSAQPVALGFDNFFRGAFSYHFHNFWWVPFDPARNWPDLGPHFAKNERAARSILKDKENQVVLPSKSFQAPPASGTVGTSESSNSALPTSSSHPGDPRPIGPKLERPETVEDDVRDLSWATVIKRTFEAYIRGERPNMYGEYIVWS